MSSPLSEFLNSLPSEGTFSLWFGPVSGEADTVRDETSQHYAASTMKLAVLIAAHRAVDGGRLDLDAQVPVHDVFASAADGSPFQMTQNYDNDDAVWDLLGHTASLRWLAERMIVVSSNLASNLVLEAVGVPEVQSTLVALGLRESSVTRGIEDTVAREAGLPNLVSAAGLAVTLQAVMAGTAASQQACQLILETLGRQEIRDTIPAGLPPGTRVAHKSGWVDGITHDAGIVFPEDAEPFILVVCTTSELTEGEGCQLIAQAAAAAWQERELTT